MMNALKRFSTFALESVLPQPWPVYIELTSWVLWVNLIDLGNAVALVIMGALAFMAVLPSTAGAQESGLPMPTERVMTNPSLMAIFLAFMAMFLLHLVLKEIVIPRLPRKADEEKGRPMICQGCSDLEVMKAMVKERKEAQDKFEERVIRDISRLFELVDERKVRR
jgi:hypothetical protein